MRRSGSPGRSALTRHLREGAFQNLLGPEAHIPLRIGLEIEMIPLDADTGATVPCVAAEGRSTRAVLDRLAMRLGWVPGTTPAGAPRYTREGGGIWSFEPGGQLEYSSPPFHSVDRLQADVMCAVDAVAREAESDGIRLASRGVDPVNPPSRIAFPFGGERYRRMEEHFGRRGPAGRCMMTQTAALHLNVDPPSNGLRAWRLANAMTPVLVATFANSPIYQGLPTGYRSWRAEQWRRLDPDRTGLFAPSSGPVEAYLDFALEAPAFLLGAPDDETRPFRDWLECGVGLEDFAGHLTTLFPEVRPRGYLEIRSPDALPASWCVAPLVVIAGVLHDAEATQEASDLLPAPTPERLSEAGREGLCDPQQAALARDLLTIAVEGARRLGEGVVSGDAIEKTEHFLEHWTARGLDPGSSPAFAWNEVPTAP